MTSDYQLFACTANDGLKLSGRIFGYHNPDPTPIVALSGFSKNSLDFYRLGVFLASKQGGNRKLLALDYRGRGLSEYDKNWSNYNIFIEAEDVISATTAIGFSHVQVIGSSHGGLITMVLSAMRPSMLKAIVLNDIGPVINPRGFLRIRTAMKKYRNPKSWKQAEEEFIRIGRTQFPALSQERWVEETRRVYKEENGKIIPRYDRKLLKVLGNVSIDDRLDDMWPEFAGLSNLPLLTLRGEHSDMLDMKTLEKMNVIHPNMKFAQVKGQGHAPRLGVAGIPQTIAKFLKQTQ